MERRGAEKQPDGTWKVWTLDSAVPLSDGSWVVTTIQQSHPTVAPLPGVPRGEMRISTLPFPTGGPGEVTTSNGYYYYDEWRSANGTLLAPQQNNNSSDWRGMFTAFQDSMKAAKHLGSGMTISYEYIAEGGASGFPRVIYHLLDGKVYDADDPMLQKQITLPGKFYGGEITRQKMLDLQAFRETQAK